MFTLFNPCHRNANNVEPKSNELKGILAVWRDRLPNVWDGMYSTLSNSYVDINIWSDLVAWRQHVFGIVNKTYMPLLPALTSAGTASVPQSSFAYRGYHETAWIINRFANVARKHKLFEVCVSQLTKIYTLPNIEIHEAFYKLREQAKCFVMTPTEWPSGLDVVNNTNLMYFGLSQRAEFFSLKGIFLSKLKMHEEAVTAFSSATQIDVQLPQAWAAWGAYNDQLFNEATGDKEALTHAADAVNCYMHASALYNSAKSRKYLARVLWLLSVDNDEKIISTAYEGYKGETPVWYWISFIPQLLTALSGKECMHARQILMKLAKNFPQV
jgi:transformation/transcription domain-associated protein